MVSFYAKDRACLATLINWPQSAAYPHGASAMQTNRSVRFGGLGASKGVRQLLATKRRNFAAA